MAARTESQFELLRGEIGATRSEVGELRSEVGELRSELHALGGDLRAEIHAGLGAVRRDMVNVAIAQLGSLAAIFAVLLAQTV